MSYHKFHPDFPFVKPYWKGNFIQENGMFANLDTKMKPQFNDLKSILRKSKTNTKHKRLSCYQLWVNPIKVSELKEEDTLIWLWHASFFLNFDGVKVLTDPVFFNISHVVKRKSKMPILPKNIKNIDYIVISHDHRDHFDKKTLRLIVKNSPDVKFIVGLNNEKLLKNIVPKEQVISLGWYQQVKINKNLKINFLPAEHRGRRGINDTAKRLWGSFLFEVKKKKIYFGGDSWYADHFKEVREIFGDIDVSLLGIGAYKTRVFAGSPHTCPWEALRAAKDMGTKTFIPMHYGTFKLGAEAMGEPIEKLKSFETPKNMTIKAINVGEKFSY